MSIYTELDLLEPSEYDCFPHLMECYLVLKHAARHISAVDEEAANICQMAYHSVLDELKEKLA